MDGSLTSRELAGRAIRFGGPISCQHSRKGCVTIAGQVSSVIEYSS